MLFSASTPLDWPGIALLRSCQVDSKRLETRGISRLYSLVAFPSSTNKFQLTSSHPALTQQDQTLPTFYYQHYS